MKVLLENFTETIHNQIMESKQYYYRENEKEKEENALRNAVIQQQRG